MSSFNKLNVDFSSDTSLLTSNGKYYTPGTGDTYHLRTVIYRVNKRIRLLIREIYVSLEIESVRIGSKKLQFDVEVKHRLCRVVIRLLMNPYESTHGEDR